MIRRRTGAGRISIVDRADLDLSGFKKSAEELNLPHADHPLIHDEVPLILDDAAGDGNVRACRIKRNRPARPPRRLGGEPQDENLLTRRRPSFTMPPERTARRIHEE